MSQGLLSRHESECKLYYLEVELNPNLLND